MSNYEDSYRPDQTYEVRESLERGFSDFLTLDQAGIEVRSQFHGGNTERELGDRNQEALPPRRPVQPPSGEVDASRRQFWHESTSLGEELVRALARGPKVEGDLVQDYVPPQYRSRTICRKWRRRRRRR